MWKRLLSLGAAAASALAAAGCGDGPATVAGGWRSPATWSSFFYATADGPLLLEVHGAPFDGPPEPFRLAVAEAMADSVPGRPFRLTTDPEAAARPGLRVVLAFGPMPGLSPAELCAGRIATRAQSGDRVTLLAAFCAEGAPLASVTGWVAKVAGPDDPRFRRLLGQAMRDLIGEQR